MHPSTMEMRSSIVKTVDILLRHLDAKDSSDAAKAIIATYMVKIAAELMDITGKVLEAEGFKDQ